MYQKIIAFVLVHGYTYKSFLLSMVVFPPAAAFIAYKKPGLGIAQRLVLGATGLFTMPVLTMTLAYAGGQVVRHYVAR